MKNIFIFIFFLFSLQVCIAEDESELLLKHYQAEISKHLDNGDVFKAREELNSAKKLAPEVVDGLKSLESRILKVENASQLRAREKGKTALEQQRKSEEEEKAKVEKDRLEKLAKEAETKAAWKKSLPDRRCACIDLSRYTKHLINEELSKPVFNKLLVYQNQNRAKAFEEAIDILDLKVSDKRCTDPVDLTATMGQERRYDLWQSQMQKCNIGEILK